MTELDLAQGKHIDLASFTLASLIALSLEAIGGIKGHFAGLALENSRVIWL